MKKNLLLIMLAGASLLTAGIGYAGAPSRVDDGPTTDPTTPTTPDPVQIQSVSPANGKTLKSLDEVVFYLNVADALDENTGNQMLPLDLNKIYITKAESTDKIEATELGIIDPVYGSNYQVSAYGYPVSFNAITEAGTYTIHAEEGAFAEASWEEGVDDADGKYTAVADGKKSAAFTSTFTINPSYNPLSLNLLTPANYAELGCLEHFTLDFQELAYGTEVEESSDAAKAITISGPDESGASTAKAVVGANWDNMTVKSYKITFQDADDNDITFTKEGQYTFTIPAGYFTFDGNESPVITATVTVGAPVELTVSPTTGSTMRSIKQITLSYNMESGLYLEPNEDLLDQITLTPKNSGTAISASSTGAFSEAGLPVIFATPVTADGEYTLSVPAGFFVEKEVVEYNGDYISQDKANGFKSAALTAEYTVSASALTVFGGYSLEPANDQTVKDISTIAISFPNIPAEAASSLYQSAPNSISISNGTDTYAGSAMQDWNYEGEGMKFNIRFMNADEEPIDAITADGDWTLTIQSGAFSYDGDSNDLITAVYHVDHTVGVAEIEGAEDGTVTVVSIDGKVLLRNAPADAVNGLENGLYIVNGKKVLVKK